MSNNNNQSAPLQVLICGGGNGAHVLAGIASAEPNTETRVFTLYDDEAQRWTNAMQDSDFVVHVRERGRKRSEIRAKPNFVTNDAARAAAGCDIIAMVVPAFVHDQYLRELKPYIRPGTVIVGFPGHSGFEFAIRGILGDIAKECTVLNFESLPFTCRLKHYGKEVEILGTKAELLGSAQYGNTPPLRDIISMLQRIVGRQPTLKLCGHLLGMTLMGVSSLVHSTILYGKWHKWDGVPVDYPPLFFNGIDSYTANLVSAVSDETVMVSQEVTKQRPNIDLSNVSHIYDWYTRCYPDDILDNSDLETSIRTNRAYVGIAHPCKKTEDEKYVPDYTFRYCTEDIPFGLVVMRGIAEIMGVSTPNIDNIITWAEEQMGKEYLVDGKLKGRDLCETRAPQRYGITTLDGLLGLTHP